MFNYSEHTKPDPSPVVYSMNITQFRIQIRRYAKSLKLEDVDETVDDCIKLVRHWLNTGEISSKEDEEDALKACRQFLSSRAQEEGYANSHFGKTQTICWRCKNAVPKIHDGRYIRGCAWSIKHAPVPGWTADKYILEDRVTYKVKECPKFKEG